MLALATFKWRPAGSSTMHHAHHTHTSDNHDDDNDDVNANVNVNSNLYSAESLSISTAMNTLINWQIKKFPKTVRTEYWIMYFMVHGDCRVNLKSSTKLDRRGKDPATEYVQR